GHAEVHLPVYFPTDSIKAGTVHFLADLAFDSGTGEFTATAMPTATDKDGNPIGLAQLFTFDPSQIGLLNKLLLGVDGLDLFLEGLQDLLDGEVFGFKLPLIGSQLSGVGDVIANFRTGFLEDFRHAIEDLAAPPSPGSDPISKILFDLLGPKPEGLGLLLDLNNDHVVDIGDIV